MNHFVPLFVREMPPCADTKHAAQDGMADATSSDTAVAQDTETDGVVETADLPVADGGNELPGGRMLSTAKLVDILRDSSMIDLSAVPTGVKENVWYKVDSPSVSG